MKLIKKTTYKNFLATGMALASFFVISAPSSFADSIGETRTFFVNQEYDKTSRTSVSATLRDISNKAYFYVEDQYWASLSPLQRNVYLNNLDELGNAFDQTIYLKEIQFFGSEPNPGIDGDPRIVILLQDLAKGIGGYFETANLYSKNLAPTSNERELVVVNTESVGSSAKLFLTHEFQHLISFNQKELIRRVGEDIWLNELRSEYANTAVGYNDVFYGSNLERRLSEFVRDPIDSLTEWPNVIDDYAHVALFAEYLSEQFGPSIISETLKSSLVGIASLDQYLQSSGRREQFSDVFANWLTALYLNDFFRDPRHGYQRSELRGLRVMPSQHYLSYPSIYNIALDVKPWEGSWQQLNFYGLPAGKTIKIDFNPEAGFKLWYIDGLGNMGPLPDNGQVPDKGGLNRIVLIPVNENKRSDFGTNETAQTFRAVIDFADVEEKPALKNGDLIKRPHEKEIYVIEGKYKRYLRPEVIKLYGHLDASKAVELDNDTFNSYTTANYVRYINEKKVYAVWPDGTKHWLNMTGEYFTQSGRDWNALFIINELELNFYQTGADIVR